MDFLYLQNHRSKLLCEPCRFNRPEWNTKYQPRYTIIPAIVNLVAAISEIIVISWWPSYEQHFLCIIFPSITDPDHLEEQTP